MGIQLGLQTSEILFYSNTTNWSNELKTIKENINDTIPNYHIQKLPEKDIEALLKKSELTMPEKENKKKLNLN